MTFIILLSNLQINKLRLATVCAACKSLTILKWEKESAERFCAPPIYYKEKRF